MSLYMESRVTVLLSEVYIFAPIKPCIYLLKAVSSVLSSAYFLWKLTVIFILFVKFIEEICEEDESDSYCHLL